MTLFCFFLSILTLSSAPSPFSEDDTISLYEEHIAVGTVEIEIAIVTSSISFVDEEKEKLKELKSF